MSSIWQSIKEKMGGLFSSNKLKEALKKSAPKSSGGGSLMQKLITMRKPPIEKYYPAIISVALAYGAADLTNTYLRVYTIPSQIPTAQPGTSQRIATGQQRLRSEYSAIESRNIFNSDGIIPPPISGGDSDQDTIDGPAVPSSLPLKLLGTIVHVNPAKSVATIEVSGAQAKVIPYIPNDEIDDMATLLKVERRRVIFRNNQNRRLEYIEMPKDIKFTFKVGNRPPPGPVGGDGINRQGDTFEISRSMVDEQLANVGDVLQQARAVPNRDPVTGEINGFKMLYIKPDSIFTKLGLKPGDVLQEVNGNPLTSIQQAMELYQGLKGSNNITLRIEREGRSVSRDYNIN